MRIFEIIADDND